MIENHTYTFYLIYKILLIFTLGNERRGNTCIVFTSNSREENSCYTRGSLCNRGIVQFINVFKVRIISMYMTILIHLIYYLHCTGTQFCLAIISLSVSLLPWKKCLWYTHVFNCSKLVLWSFMFISHRLICSFNSLNFTS